MCHVTQAAHCDRPIEQLSNQDFLSLEVVVGEREEDKSHGLLVIN